MQDNCDEMGGGGGGVSGVMTHVMPSPVEKRFPYCAYKVGYCKYCKAMGGAEKCWIEQHCTLLHKTDGIVQYSELLLMNLEQIGFWAWGVWGSVFNENGKMEKAVITYIVID